MSEPIRDAALEEWRRVINDEFWWRSHIYEQASKCRDFADAMLASSIIDPLERLEFEDLITGAVSHFSEQREARWIICSADYVVVDRTGQPAGYLFGSLLGWGPKKKGIMEFDGQIYPDDSACIVHSRISKDIIYAEIYGRWMAREGEWYALVEKERRFNGVMVRRLADPDCYRFAVDMATISLETANFKQYWRWRDCHYHSVFSRCLHCNDHSIRREECCNCAGLGFVGMRDCPSAIPDEWPAAPPSLKRGHINHEPNED